MDRTQTAALFDLACRGRVIAVGVLEELAPVTTLAAIQTASAKELHDRINRSLRVARQLVAELEKVGTVGAS